MKASGLILMFILAALGGFVAGMLWLASLPVLDPVAAYCRGNIEGYHMASAGPPDEAAMVEAEKNCYENLMGEFDLEKFGFRGPLVP
jgi:hypothetical protein